MAPDPDDALTVQIAAARPIDANKGIVRLPTRAYSYGMEHGCVVALSGSGRTTVALFHPAHEEDEGLDIIRVDTIGQLNCGGKPGDALRVTAVQPLAAERIILAPEDGTVHPSQAEGRLRAKLIGRPLCQGDRLGMGVYVEARDLPAELRAMLQEKAYAAKDIRFLVLETIPEGFVVATPDTRFTVLREPWPHSIEREQPEALSQDVRAQVFTLAEDGRIDLAAARGAGNLLRSAEALSRHSELCRLLQTILDLCDGSNSAAHLAPRVEALTSALGKLDGGAGELNELPQPALIIMRGAALRHELARIDADESSGTNPLPAPIVLALRAAMRAYDAYVWLDPSLRERDRLILSSEASSDEEREQLVRSAIGSDIATPQATAALMEEIWTAGIAGPEAEPRRARAIESVRNFARRALQAIWTYKWKIGAGAAGFNVALYQLGKWALANEAVLTKLLGGTEAGVQAIRAIMAFLKTMPLN